MILKPKSGILSLSEVNVPQILGSKTGKSLSLNPVNHWILNDNAASVTIVDSTGNNNVDLEELNSDVWSVAGKLTRAISFNGVPTLSANLRGHYDCNDNAANTTVADRSGNNKTGSSTNNTSTMTGTGKINEAIYFDGASEQVSLPDDMLSGLTAFNVSTWIKFETNTGVHSHFVSLSFDYAGDKGLIMGRREEGDAKAKQFLIYIGNNDGGVAAEYIFNQVLENDVWYHISLNHTGTTSTLYLNGVLVETKTTQAFVAGGAFDTFGREATKYHKGPMDDVRIYDRVLTAGEISAIYNSGDGFEDSTYVSDSGYVDTSNKSICFWYNQNTVPSGTRMGRLGHTYLTLNGSGKFRIEYFDGSVYRNLSYSSGGGNNAWHHVVVTFTPNGSNTDVISYIDGVLDVSETLTGTRNTSSTGVQIGFSDTFNWYRGLIEDMRVYNIVLNQEQVDLIYNGGTGTEITNISLGGSSFVLGETNSQLELKSPDSKVLEFEPIAHWNMNEATGSYVIDSIGGFTGSLISGAGFGAGKIGSAINLNGSDSYIQCNDIGSMISSQPGHQWSISSWINTNNSGLSISGPTQVIVGTNMGDNPTFSINSREGNLSSGLTLRIDDSRIVTDKGIVLPNVWNHTVATFSMGNTGSPYFWEGAIYLNNELVKSGSRRYATGGPDIISSKGQVGLLFNEDNGTEVSKISYLGGKSIKLN